MREGRKEGRTGGRTNGWTEGLTKKRTDRRKNEQRIGRTDEKKERSREVEGSSKQWNEDGRLLWSREMASGKTMQCASLVTLHTLETQR